MIWFWNGRIVSIISRLIMNRVINETKHISIIRTNTCYWLQFDKIWRTICRNTIKCLESTRYHSFSNNQRHSARWYIFEMLFETIFRIRWVTHKHSVLDKTRFRYSNRMNPTVIRNGMNDSGRRNSEGVSNNYHRAIAITPWRDFKRSLSSVF